MSTLADYQYLWDGTVPGWVLVLSDDPDSGTSHIVYNEHKQTILMIDDPETSILVVEQMLAKGVKIIAEMPETEFRMENLELED